MCGEGLIYVPASQKCIIPPPKPTPNNANSTTPSTLNPTSNATEIPVVPNITTNINCGTN